VSARPLRFKTYYQMNAWLLDKCIAYAKAHHHPELTEQTIWEVFEAERSKLVPYAGRFDGFHAVPASVSKTCLVRFDNNKYSVAASAVGRPVDVHAYADRIVIRQDGRIVAEQSHRAVQAAGNNTRAVGGERDAQDLAVVSLEWLRSGLAVERPQRTVPSLPPETMRVPSGARGLGTEVFSPALGVGPPSRFRRAGSRGESTQPLVAGPPVGRPDLYRALPAAPYGVFDE